MQNYKREIAYIGQSTNFYQRMEKFKPPRKLKLDDITDIYFIRMKKEYIKGIEAVMIGLVNPYANTIKYACFDTWKPYINHGLHYAIKRNLKEYHKCILPEDVTLKEFIMKCEYKNFPRRLGEGFKLVMPYQFGWHDMTKRNILFSTPLIEIIETHLKVGILN